MSRYTTNYASDVEVTIGWDPPLNTYFGIVKITSRDEDDQIVRWVGTTPLELYEIDDLQRAIGPQYRDFVTKHASDLYGDKDEGR